MRLRNNLMSRKKTNSSTDLVFLVLIAGLVWEYRFLAIKAILILGSIWLIGGLVILIKLIRNLRNKYTKNSLNTSLSDIDKMTGLEFEKYVAFLLKQQGYINVRLTEKYDLGIDIIAIKDGITWGIQVKRYSGLVKANAIRQVITALKHYNCDRAMVITNSTYSNIAITLAKSNKCVLVDRFQFIG